MQANRGAVTVQAQNDELQLNALKDATLTSSAGKVTIAAKEEILITCKGAYIKLSNGEVEIGSPKVVRVRAPLVVGGVKSAGVNMKNMPTVDRYNQQFVLQLPSGRKLKEWDVQLNSENEELFLETSKQGKTERIYSDKQETLSLDNVWYEIEFIQKDKGN